MYFVVLSQRADKYLSKLSKDIGERIKKKLKFLGNVPVPSDAKFLGRHKGDKLFRYRVGNYRALYKIKEENKTVLIAKIDKRPRVYSKMDF